MQRKAQAAPGAQVTPRAPRAAQAALQDKSHFAFLLLWGLGYFFFLFFFLQLCPLGVNLTQCKSLEGWSPPQGPVLLLARPWRLQGRCELWLPCRGWGQEREVLGVEILSQPSGHCRGSVLSCVPWHHQPCPARLVPVVLQGLGSPELAAAVQGTRRWLHPDTPRAAAETCLGPWEALKCHQK